MQLTRRKFFRSSAALAAATALPSWLSEPLLAQIAQPIRRYNVNTTDALGKASVRAYREAVAVLKGRKDHDPGSWIWWANIHGYPGQRSDPEGEYGRVFPAAGIPGVSGPERQRLVRLARETWRQCPHGSEIFLPWHRVYLHAFERLLQAATGESTLAIPYWDWTHQRELPVVFSEPIGGSPANNPLFESSRNYGRNAPGEQRIVFRDNEVSVEFLAEPTLDDRLEDVPAGLEVGFSPFLEGGPHGGVHVGVGGLMGGVERAARDPVFWLHHANVDRLWESWARLPGHANPQSPRATAWLNQEHKFPQPDGSVKGLTTQQVLVAARIMAGAYEYEKYEQPEGVQVAGKDGAGDPAARPATAPRAQVAPASLARTEPVLLSNAPATVKLDTSASQFGPASLPPGAKLYLGFRSLTADKPVGDNFAVYINLPPGTAPDQSSGHLAGNVNFFGAPPSGPAPAGAHQHSVDRLIDITSLMSRLAAEGKWSGDAVTVTLIPVAGGVEADAKPQIETIELIRR
jgi:tyrosinase